MEVYDQMAALQKAQRRQLDLLQRCLDRIEEIEWRLDELEDPIAPNEQEAVTPCLLDHLEAQAEAKTSTEAKGGTA